MIYTKLVLVAACAVGALAAKGKSGGGAKEVASSTVSASAALASEVAAVSPSEIAAAAANSQGGLNLNSKNVQAGTQQNGLSGAGVEDFEAASQTSNNNFINFCSGKTLTNGLQVVGGSCNGIVMGDIPAKTNMVSSTITFPTTGGTVAANQTFNITVQTANLEAGSFTNAQTTYYSAPQSLKGGNVVGHTHVTVQDLGKSLNPTVALDATQFAFFKGINDAGNGKGLLSAEVAGGLPPGNYRVCTMASASNHQPVLMPVAQRGTPDDCTKFTVKEEGGAGNGGNAKAAAASKASTTTAATGENGAKAAAASAATDTAAAGGKGKGKGGAMAKVADTSAASAAAATASSVSAGRGGRKGAGKKGGKFREREFIA